MGLLDDAIREHLDLKRRRGADPTEVERSEREALGPVRRTPERGPGDDHDRGLEGGAAPGAIYEDGLVSSDEAGEAAFAPDEPDVHEPLGEERAEPHSGESGAPPASTSSSLELDEDEPSWNYDKQSLAHDRSPGPQAGLAPAPHRADSERLDDHAGHTAENEVAAALDSEPRAEPSVTDPEAEAADEPSAPAHAEPHEHAASGEDEDVLEETPEFLQDTPDHDRLWFEQRPPKDFNFDG